MPRGPITSLRTAKASSRLIVAIARALKATYHVDPGFASAKAVGSAEAAAARKLERCGAHTVSKGNRRTTKRAVGSAFCAANTDSTNADGEGNSGTSAFLGQASTASPLQ